MLDLLGLGRTDQGRVREANEDVMVVQPELGLYLVCDGMGGHAAGDVAAATAAATIVRQIEQRSDLLTAVGRAPSRAPELATLLSDSLQEACRDIYYRATSDPRLAGMGCTATAVLLSGAKGVMAHVGDTRLYLVRNGQAHQLSNDHTMAAQLFRQGAISADELPSHPRRNVLTKAMGTQPLVDVEMLIFDIVAGDRLLLCSDGLSDHLPSDAWLAERLAEPMEDVPDQLVDFANAAGGHDNVTVVVVGAFADTTETRPADGSPEVVLDVLGSSFLFGDLSLAQLSRLIERCSARTFAAGEVLWPAGDLLDELVIVISGQITVATPDGRTNIAGAGSHLGESLVLRPRPIRATLTAEVPTRTLSLSRSALLSLATQRPWLGVTLLTRINERLSGSVDRLTGNPENHRIVPGDLL